MNVVWQEKNEFIPVIVKLVWDYPENFTRGRILLKPFCKFWNWVINRNHYFTERFLCYMFGGISDARFVLRKK